jgi:hypothetical protein
MTTPATPPPPAPVPPAIHELKTWPEYFDAVRDGRKTFEIRRNDRDFKVGDVLLLQEYDLPTNQYSGYDVSRRITYITDYAQADGIVVMGIEPVDATRAEPMDEAGTCPICGGQTRERNDVDVQFHKANCPRLIAEPTEVVKAIDFDDPNSRFFKMKRIEVGADNKPRWVKSQPSTTPEDKDVTEDMVEAWHKANPPPAEQQVSQIADAREGQVASRVIPDSLKIGAPQHEQAGESLPSATIEPSSTPSGEDGPWAEGWNERSASESSGDVHLARALERIAELEAEQAFLKSKGLTVGMLKESGKEPRLAYVIEPESELCDLRTIHENIDLKRALATAATKALAQEAKLSERMTVHEWLNALDIPREEAGKQLCLLRRLRITCDLFQQIKDQPSADDVILIRCTKHLNVGQQNKNEASGGECGGCIAAERDATLARAESCKVALNRAFWVFESQANAEEQIGGAEFWQGEAGKIAHALATPSPAPVAGKTNPPEISSPLVDGGEKDSAGPREYCEPRVHYVRREDMSPDGTLTLMMQDDGDMIVTVWGRGMGDLMRMASVEFCSPTGGGGRSPNTIMALRTLALAMKHDNVERDDSPPVAGEEGGEG